MDCLRAGLSSQTIMQVAGNTTQQESVADENTLHVHAEQGSSAHCMCRCLQATAQCRHADCWSACALQVMQSMQKGKELSAQRKKAQAKQKRQQRAEKKRAAPADAVSTTQSEVASAMP